ncbi:hypothetical protein ABIE45_001232 [Methylobacterium sp. OAE515]|uniref:hypothetical protein n=1 Tax=Methylobacterium sp. OAE515 TaxID=2817895 RepID=UPI00178B72A5
MSPLPINVPPDRFTRLEQVGERDGRLIFRVATVAEEAFTVTVGELLTIDPESRAADFQSEFAVRTSAGIALAGVGPLHGRPKDRGGGLTLRSAWRDNAQADIPLSPAQFAAACIGRHVSASDAPSHEAVPETLWLEIDRARADEERREADRAGARLAAARAAGWRAPLVSGHLGESPPRKPLNFRGPEGSCDIDKITRKLLEAGRVINALLPDEDATSLFVHVRAMALGFGEVAYKIAKERAEAWPQVKADRRQINDHLRSIIENLEGFLDHVDHDDARLFLDFTAPIPDNEDHPVDLILGNAERALMRARKRAKCLIASIKYLETTLHEPIYGRDSRKDHLANEFVDQMASSWRLLTSETPGRTGNGLFEEYVRSAWLMMGWEARPHGHFAKRIEAGVHLNGG